MILVKTIAIVIQVVVLASCTTPTNRTLLSTAPLYPLVLVLYPDTTVVTPRASASFDEARQALTAEFASTVFEPSMATSSDPERAAVLRYGRFVDEDSAANDLRNALGSRIWNATHSSLAFGIGDAMVHLDTTMRVRSDNAKLLAKQLQTQYVLSVATATFDVVDGRPSISARVVVTYPTHESTIMDSTFLVRADSNNPAEAWTAAIMKISTSIARSLPGLIKQTLPRYLQRAATIAHRKLWFKENLASTRPDEELIAALASDSLQPLDADHYWMLRSPDGSKAVVATVASFDREWGLKVIRNCKGPSEIPENTTDTARMAFTLYAMERLDSQWLFRRLRTTFRLEPAITEDLRIDLLFEALRPHWYDRNDGTPGGTFWQESLFRRINGTPILEYDSKR